MRCPICGTDAVVDIRPFCSTRCAEIDLGRWMTGAYRVPENALSDDETDPEDAARGSMTLRGDQV